MAPQGRSFYRMLINAKFTHTHTHAALRDGRLGGRNLVATSNAWVGLHHHHFLSFSFRIKICVWKCGLKGNVTGSVGLCGASGATRQRLHWTPQGKITSFSLPFITIYQECSKQGTGRTMAPTKARPNRHTAPAPALAPALNPTRINLDPTTIKRNDAKSTNYRIKLFFRGGATTHINTYF